MSGWTAEAPTGTGLAVSERPASGWPDAHRAGSPGRGGVSTSGRGAAVHAGVKHQSREKRRPGYGQDEAPHPQEALTRCPSDELGVAFTGTDRRAGPLGSPPQRWPLKRPREERRPQLWQETPTGAADAPTLFMPQKPSQFPQRPRPSAMTPTWCPAPPSPPGSTRGPALPGVPPLSCHLS